MLFSFRKKEPHKEKRTIKGTALKWVYDKVEKLNVNPEQLGVSGDSAGGNLSAACSLLDRDLGNKLIKFQALIYPTVIY